MSQTVQMKLTGAITVGGQVVKPPAIIECTQAEAASYMRRGKAVPATSEDQPTAVTPSAENAKGEGEGANPLEGASDANPIDAQVDVGGQLVDVQIVGQDADGTVVVTEASGEAIDSAVGVVTGDGTGTTLPPADDAEKTADAVTTPEATPAAEPKAEALTPKQKREAAKAATAAAGK